MQGLVTVFKALGDSARLRIMHLLLKMGKEICACEICDSLVMTQYAVSRNVKILKHGGLVKERKEGKWVYYSPAGGAEMFYKIFYQALKALPDPDRTLKKDLERLKRRLGLRERGKCLVGIQNKKLLSSVSYGIKERCL